MTIGPEEIEQWRRAVLHGKRIAKQALDHLEREAHPQFVAICHALLQDASPIVQQVLLSLLGQHGDRDDAVAEAGAVAALPIPELQEVALFALGTVGTPASFPILLTYVRQGAREALEAAAKQARTEEERQVVLELAREQLFSPARPYRNAYLREEAVGVLRALSSIVEEEAILLRAAQRYYDMFVIEALAEGTPSILPALEDMLGRFPPGYAEYQDISYAIEGIRRRMNQVEAE